MHLECVFLGETEMTPLNNLIIKMLNRSFVFLMKQDISGYGLNYVDF